ncbi:MAG: MFS transporter [Chloroflexota bacterium]
MTNATASIHQPEASQGHKMGQTINYYIAFIALGLANASLGPTLPGLAENTQANLSQVSLLFAARSLGYLGGAVLGARLYDRFLGHWVMATMLVLTGAMFLFVPTISLLSILFIILLALGIAESTLDVGGNTLLMWVHRHDVGPYMNALHFFFGVGAFLSPIIIAQAVLRGGSLIWAYWILALLIAPVAILLLRLPSPSPPPNEAENETEGINYGLIILVAAFYFLYVGAEIGFGGWIFTYAVTLNITNELNAAYLTSAFWGALTVGRLLAIPIAARFRPSTILFADLVGGVVSVAILLIWSNSLVMLWLGTLGMGLTTASLFPMMLSFAERRMKITGKITGWFFIGASLGGTFFPWLMGQFFETVGPQIVMLIILGLLLVTIGIVIVITRLYNTIH